MIDQATLPYRPCAGIMLVNSHRQVFVGKRIDSDLDAWQMPQGGIDSGEDPEVAAIRELGEETGIVPHLVTVIARSAGEHLYDLPAEMIGILWKGKYRGQSQKWFLMRFHGSDADIDIATEHPEFERWQWVPHTQLVDLIVPFKKDLYANVIAEFLPHF